MEDSPILKSLELIKDVLYEGLNSLEYGDLRKFTPEIMRKMKPRTFELFEKHIDYVNGEISEIIITNNPVDFFFRGDDEEKSQATKDKEINKYLIIQLALRGELMQFNDIIRSDRLTVGTDRWAALRDVIKDEYRNIHTIWFLRNERSSSFDTHNHLRSILIGWDIIDDKFLQEDFDSTEDFIVSSYRKIVPTIHKIAILRDLGIIDSILKATDGDRSKTIELLYDLGLLDDRDKRANVTRSYTKVLSPEGRQLNKPFTKASIEYCKSQGVEF